MKTEKQMTDAIMKRVYGVYFLRQLSQPAVRICALFVLALTLREMVWVSRIFENISRKANAVEFFQYGLSAFAGTELSVQLVVIATVAIFAYSTKDLFGLRQPQFA